MNKAIILLGKIIRENRNKKGYSTAELAKRLDVSSGFINNLENAKNDCFNTIVLSKLCTELELKIPDLIPFYSNNNDIVLNSLFKTNIEEKNMLELNNKLESMFLNANSKDFTQLINKLIYEIDYFNNIK